MPRWTVARRERRKQALLSTNLDDLRVYLRAIGHPGIAEGSDADLVLALHVARCSCEDLDAAMQEASLNWLLSHDLRRVVPVRS